MPTGKNWRLIQEESAKYATVEEEKFSVLKFPATSEMTARENVFLELVAPNTTIVHRLVSFVHTFSIIWFN